MDMENGALIEFLFDHIFAFAEFLKTGIGEEGRLTTDKFLVGT